MKQRTRKGRHAPADAQTLREINQTAISATELRHYIDTCQAKRRPGDDEWNEIMQMMTAGDLSNRDPMRAFALYYRARGMAEIVATNDGAPGWTIKGPDGSVFVNDWVLAAAAAEPIKANTGKGGEVVFDRAKFLRRVLELSEPEIAPQ